MKTRALTLLITLLLVFSNIGMAQITDPLSIGKSPQLKTDIVGSYPQTIMEYNWMVEMWMLLQTSYISYNAQGDPTEIRVVGMKEEYRTLFTYNSDHFETESLRPVSYTHLRAHET